jgi:predicted transcriptional regulator
MRSDFFFYHYFNEDNFVLKREKAMSIEKYCQNDVVTIAQNASIQEAAKLMREKHIGSLLVTHEKEDQRPMGIITDRDIVLKIVTQKNDIGAYKVSDAMSTDLLLLPHDVEVRVAIEAMSSRGVRRAPIHKQDKICGIISLDDLMVRLAREMSDLADVIESQIQG